MLQRSLLLPHQSGRPASEDNFTVEMEVANATEIEESVPAKVREDEVDEQVTDDQEFKNNYSQEVLGRTTTLRLKASFHLINYIMISVCNVMLTHLSKGSGEDSDQSLGLPSPEADLDELEELA